MLKEAKLEMEACRSSPDQKLHCISVDVGDPAAVEKAVADAVAKLGAIQVKLNPD